MISYIYFMMVILGIAFLVVVSMIFDEMRRDLTADEKVEAVHGMPIASCMLDPSPRSADAPSDPLGKAPRGLVHG